MRRGRTRPYRAVGLERFDPLCYSHGLALQTSQHPGLGRAGIKAGHLPLHHVHSFLTVIDGSRSAGGALNWTPFSVVPFMCLLHHVDNVLGGTDRFPMPLVPAIGLPAASDAGTRPAFRGIRAGKTP